MDKKDFSFVDTLILNYLEGKSTAQDMQQLESWISESVENKKYFRETKSIMLLSAKLPLSSSKAFHRVIDQINPPSLPMMFWQVFQRIAAILIIPLLISTLWFSIGKNMRSPQPISYNKVVSAFGTFSTLELPDGSKVWLNSGSILQYPEKFSGKNRTVYLVGEAFFEVHSDKSMPFLVSTPYFTVEATGTKFNVRTEKNHLTPSVTLVEGKVNIVNPKAKGKNSILAEMKPNQHLKYDTLTKQIAITTEDTYKHFAWKDGKLVFRNDNIIEVARRISLQYNVDIEIKGEKIKQYRYRATFVNEPLSELLRLLKMSSPIDYKEINPKALPDGTYTKRKIIIYSS